MLNNSQDEAISNVETDISDLFQSISSYASSLESINNEIFQLSNTIASYETIIDGLTQNVSDSGWVNCTIGNSMSICGMGDLPAVRKTGNIVYFCGVAQTSGGWSSHASIITIPDGYRPTRKRATIQKGYGTYSYKLTVNTNGLCVAEHISNDLQGNVVTSNGEYFWFCDCWIVS